MGLNSRHKSLKHTKQLARDPADGGAQSESFVEARLHALRLGHGDTVAVAGRRVLLLQARHVGRVDTTGCGGCGYPNTSGV